MDMLNDKLINRQTHETTNAVMRKYSVFIWYIEYGYGYYIPREYTHLFIRTITA